MANISREDDLKDLAERTANNGTRPHVIDRAKVEMEREFKRRKEQTELMIEARKFGINLKFD